MRTASVLVFAIVGLAACSKSEPPTPAKTTPPVPIVAPAPPPEPVVTPPPAAPPPTVEQHIPGSPEAKTFVAANIVKQPKSRATTTVAANTVKQPKSRATNRVRVPDAAYEKAFRNAARADKLLERHAYVVSFDDVAGTNAVALGREYR